MANKKHVDLLRKGVEVWNTWRAEHPETVPSLNQADLYRVDLIGADLREADLRQADLREANLMGADLRRVNLSLADLSRAVLSRADLLGANLRQADLRQADLRQADFSEADFSRADLSEADLSRAAIGWTVFGDVDLSQTRGLETLRHVGPSTIGLDTIYRSGGRMPYLFLRNAGVPENFIAYIGSLVGDPLQLGKFQQRYVKFHRHLRKRCVTEGLEEIRVPSFYAAFARQNREREKQRELGLQHYFGKMLR